MKGLLPQLIVRVNTEGGMMTFMTVWAETKFLCIEEGELIKVGGNKVGEWKFENQFENRL